MILPCVDGDTDFPNPELALTEPDGLLCYGGDLSQQRLLAAYQRGIFPWYTAGEPILWWSPKSRMVLFPEKIHISKSLRKAMRKLAPEFYIDRDFARVINHCASVDRPDHGTWIHPEMIAAYQRLFKAGQAFCIEVEVNQQLVGGLYGVKAGKVWCGESMFSLQSNGSKMAMVGLCNHLKAEQIKLLDCQLHNHHLDSMGAELIDRHQFMQYLES